MGSPKLKAQNSKLLLQKAQSPKQSLLPSNPKPTTQNPTPLHSTQNSKPKTQHPFGGVYAGKKVLVTGHTGFKGSWLCVWLKELGANVVGYALEPYTNKDNFVVTGLYDKITHRI
jgi:hypothetical protein